MKNLTIFLIFLLFIIIHIQSCQRGDDNIDNNIVYHDKEDNNFSIGGSNIWTKQTLTYYFGESFPSNFKASIRNAFNTWDNVTSSINFTEINNSNADIVIEYGGIDHFGCPEKFNDDILAHGFYPPPSQTLGNFAGDLHFYNKWNWSIDGSTEYDIETSALHEIGHILGLGHTTNPQSVMARRYNGIRKSLHQDDINGICHLYGCNNTSQSQINLGGDLNFGNVNVGTSSSRTLIISNTGNSSLIVNSIILPNGFTGNWSGTITPGNSQHVNIIFTPTSNINYSGVLTVISNSQNGINTISINGIGTNNSNNLPTQLAFWNFENNLNDLSGNNYNLELNGTSKFSTGINGNCFYFTENPPLGSSASLTSNLFNLPSKFSISFWIKPQNQVNFPTASSPYLSFINPNGVSNLTMYRHPILAFSWFDWSVNNNSGRICQSLWGGNSPNLTDGDWHNIVLLIDLTSNSSSCYVDGVTSSSPSSITCSINLIQQKLLIRPLHSYIDQLRIFNGILTNSQIQNIFINKL